MEMNKRSLLIGIAALVVFIAVIEVCKAALSFLPNVELTSFWLIMFTLFFGWKIVLVVPVFILIEGCIYGFGLWWVAGIPWDIVHCIGNFVLMRILYRPIRTVMKKAGEY